MARVTCTGRSVVCSSQLRAEQLGVCHGAWSIPNIAAFQREQHLLVINIALSAILRPAELVQVPKIIYCRSRARQPSSSGPRAFAWPGPAIATSTRQIRRCPFMLGARPSPLLVLQLLLSLTVLTFGTYDRIEYVVIRCFARHIELYDIVHTLN